MSCCSLQGQPHFSSVRSVVHDGGKRTGGGKKNGRKKQQCVREQMFHFAVKGEKKGARGGEEKAGLQMTSPQESF